jgi:hypothetical protein
MTYQQIQANATTTWKPLPGSKNLGYYLSSGQVVFSSFIGYRGANRLQIKLNALNSAHAARK